MSDAWHIVINKVTCYCHFIITLIIFKKEIGNKEQIVLRFLTLKRGSYPITNIFNKMKHIF